VLSHPRPSLRLAVRTRTMVDTNLLNTDPYARHGRELADDADVEELRQRPTHRPEPAYGVLRDILVVLIRPHSHGVHLDVRRYGISLKTRRRQVERVQAGLRNSFENLTENVTCSAMAKAEAFCSSAISAAYSASTPSSSCPASSTSRVTDRACLDFLNCCPHPSCSGRPLITRWNHDRSAFGYL
jgi:hypothetical protein